MEPRCRRCGAPEAIVTVTLNRGGPRRMEWCQRCLDAFRVWAALPPEPERPKLSIGLLEEATSMIQAALAAEGRG